MGVRTRFASPIAYVLDSRHTMRCSVAASLAHLMVGGPEAVHDSLPSDVDNWMSACRRFSASEHFVTVALTHQAPQSQSATSLTYLSMMYECTVWKPCIMKTRPTHTCFWFTLLATIISLRCRPQAVIANLELSRQYRLALEFAWIIRNFTAIMCSNNCKDCMLFNALKSRYQCSWHSSPAVSSVTRAWQIATSHVLAIT